VPYVEDIAIQYPAGQKAAEAVQVILVVVQELTKWMAVSGLLALVELDGLILHYVQV
jgi:hypothetical protein